MPPASERQSTRAIQKMLHTAEYLPLVAAWNICLAADHAIMTHVSLGCSALSLNGREVH
jgi:hypothetical protein